MKYLKMLLALSLILILTGCESDEKTLVNFNNNMQIKCGEGPLTYPTVVTKNMWDYSENLERFYNQDGKNFEISQCSSN